MKFVELRFGSPQGIEAQTGHTYIYIKMFKNTLKFVYFKLFLSFFWSSFKWFAVQWSFKPFISKFFWVQNGHWNVDRFGALMQKKWTNLVT